MSRLSRQSAEPPVVACTLGPGELPGQLERWRNLYAAAGIERRVTDDGLRVSFRPDGAVEEEVRALVAVEAECCRWASWSIEGHAEALVLEATSTGDGVPVLHSWLLDEPPLLPASGT